MALTVYGIPSCGTVKKALGWFASEGRPASFVNFRETPPSAEQVARWVAAFGVNAMKNTSGGAYRDLGADKDSWTDKRWTQAFAADPMLIKRPVVERDGKPLLVGWKLSDEELRKLLA